MTLGKAYYKFCSTRAGYLAARASRRAFQTLGLFRKPCMPIDALGLDHQSARGLMQLWQHMHWSSGDGMMPPEDLLTVYRLACTWPAKGDIVELGSWVGLTTSYLGAACRVRGDGKVYAVDTFQGTKEDGDSYASIEKFEGSTFQAFRDQIDRANVADLVKPLVGYTSQVATSYQGRPIRVLLIDADHSYEGVRSDFELWSPMVTMGGLIIFHDYHMPGVARFVDEDLRHHADYAHLPGQVQPRIVAVTKRATTPTSAKIDDPGGQRVFRQAAENDSHTWSHRTSL